MRRFITLATIALSTLFAAPVLAAPGGPGNGPKGHGPGVTQNDGTPGAWGYHDSGGPGFGKPGAMRPQPARVLTGTELRKAKYLTRSFDRQKASLVRQLNVAERYLQTLQHRRSVRPAAIRAAKVKVASLERKIAKLEMKYRMSLAQFLTPAQVRFFLALS